MFLQYYQENKKIDFLNCITEQGYAGIFKPSEPQNLFQNCTFAVSLKFL